MCAISTQLNERERGGKGMERRKEQGKERRKGIKEGREGSWW
jgi:hypothetical protein